MTKVKYKVVPTGILKGDVPLSRFYVLHNGTVRDEAVYEEVSRKSGQPLPLVKATLAMTFGEIMENLRHGYRVEFDEMSAFLTIPGTVESISSESRRESDPRLVGHLVAKGAFKTCCQRADVETENITKAITVVVDDVSDEVSRMLNVLTNGIDVNTHGTGRGLLITDFTDPTTGMFIADMDGKVLAKANIIESTSTTFICVFPQLNLPEGTYKFCLASRNGADPAQYGVTIGSKNIRIVNAAPAEDAGV